MIGNSLKHDLEKKLEKKYQWKMMQIVLLWPKQILEAARGFKVVFGVIMGTGVGGGVVIDGKLHPGRNHIGGEWGHHTLHHEGISCYCGKKGCVEKYLSGPSLEKNWTKLTGKSQPLRDIILNLDESNKVWKTQFLENFGYGLANIIDILDPDVIVLGGGLSNINFLYTEGKESVYDKVFSDFIDTPIIRNKLGDSAGVFGAALLP